MLGPFLSILRVAVVARVFVIVGTLRCGWNRCHKASEQSDSGYIFPRVTNETSVKHRSSFVVYSNLPCHRSHWTLRLYNTSNAKATFDRIWSPRGQSSNAWTFITKQSRCLLVPSRSLAATMAMRYKGRQSFKGYKCMPNGTVSGSGISPRPIVRNEIAWDVSSCWKDAVYGLLIERGTMNGPGMINRS